MQLSLRHWTKPGKAERVYVNGYPGGASVHAEADGTGVAIRSSGPGAPDPARVASDLARAFPGRTARWADLVAACGSRPPAAAPEPPARTDPRPRPQPPRAAGLVDLRGALAGRSLSSPTRLVVGPRVAPATREVLSALGGLRLDAGEAPHCDAALPGRMAFVVTDVAALSGAPGPLLDAARLRDGAYPLTHLVAEGDPSTLGAGLPALASNLAALACGTSTNFVPSTSPAHTGLAMAFLLIEALG